MRDLPSRNNGASRAEGKREEGLASFVIFCEEEQGGVGKEVCECVSGGLPPSPHLTLWGGRQPRPNPNITAGRLNYFFSLGSRETVPSRQGGGGRRRSGGGGAASASARNVIGKHKSGEDVGGGRAIEGGRDEKKLTTRVCE